MFSNSNALSCCRSSSVSSEVTTAEKETPEEEEAQKDVAAPVEELVAAAPSAVCEVPVHLRKQAVSNKSRPPGFQTL